MNFDLIVKRAAQLYEALGYQLELVGYEPLEVNFLATQSLPGLGKQRFEVYCWPHAATLQAGDEATINAFANIAHFHDDAVDGTILVCEREQADTLRGRLKENQFIVISFDELVSGKIDYFSYEASISETPLKDGVPIDVYIRKDVFKNLKSARNHWSDAYHAWLEDPTQPNLFVTANEGTEKDLILRAIAAETATRSISIGLEAPRIFFVTLGDLYFSTSVEEAIQKSVERTLGEATAEVDILPTLETKRCFIFFECIDCLSSNKRANFLKSAVDLSEKHGSRLIFSCRPAFVVKELPSLFPRQRMEDFNSWQVAGLSKMVLQQAVKSLQSSISSDYVETINDHLAYPDIVSLMISAAKSGEFGNNNHVPFTQVFVQMLDFVTNSLISTRSSQKTHDASIEKLKQLAVHYGTGQSSLIFEDSYEDLKFLLPYFGTLLVVAPSGEIEFAHPEYFGVIASEYLAACIENGDKISFALGPLHEAVVLSLPNFEVDRLSLSLWLQEESESSDKSAIFSQNIRRLLESINISFGHQVPDFKVVRLQLRNIKCFEDVDIHFGNASREGLVNLIVGDNGAGKSTVLKCIALCSLGPDLANKVVGRPSSLLRSGSETGVICADFVTDGIVPEEETRFTVALGVSADSRSFSLLTKGSFASRNHERFLELRDDTEHSGLFVSGYGASRNFDASEDVSRRKEDDPLIERIRSLFDPYTVLVDPDGLERLISGDGSSFVAYDAPPQLPAPVSKSVANILQRLLPADETFQFDDEGMLRTDYGSINIAELSDGYRCTLAWASHLVVNVLSGLDWKSPVDDVRGILLVDEIDLHLHPKWQRIILDRIVQLFPNLQIIVTSHSPLVVGGSFSTSGKLFLCSLEDGRSKVDVFDGDMRGWRFDQVLATELFGYIIDRDPSTERVLREASILHGKGEERTEEEERRYQIVTSELSKLDFDPGQTSIERAVSGNHRRQVVSKIAELEKELFGEPS
ncbi:MAG: AAA family ATPase [Pseudomonadota bacterium]